MQVRCESIPAYLFYNATADIQILSKKAKSHPQNKYNTLIIYHL